MTALRVFPFIGALIAIGAVVLTIVGVATDFWFVAPLSVHAGKSDENIKR
jgi:hypothetical protein